jgi:hypothetical protein
MKIHRNLQVSETFLYVTIQFYWNVLNCIHLYFRLWLNENHFQFTSLNRKPSYEKYILIFLYYVYVDNSKIVSIILAPWTKKYVQNCWNVVFNKFEHKTLLWEPKLYLPVCELSPYWKISMYLLYQKLSIFSLDPVSMIHKYKKSSEAWKFQWIFISFLQNLA